MKIVKQGKVDDNIYRGTCRNCGTEIEFDKNEAKYVSDQRDGDFLTMRCPTYRCGMDINVSVRTGLKRRERY